MNKHQLIGPRQTTDVSVVLPVTAAAAPMVPYSVDDRHETTILDYARSLRQRKTLLVLGAIAGLSAAALITLLETPVYTSRAAVEIQDINQSFLRMKDISPVGDASGVSALSDVQTQVRIVQSETVLSHAARRAMEMARSEHAQYTYLSLWRSLLRRSRTPVDLSRELSLTNLAKKLRVRAIGQTRIIELSYQSPDPALSANVVTAVAQSYIEQNAIARSEINQRTGALLSKQLDELRSRLERSEAAAQSFARQSGVLFGNLGTTSASEQKLGQLQSGLSEAQSTRMAREASLTVAKNSPQDSVPEVLADATLREYQTALTALRRQRAELSVTYTDDNAKIARIDAQIESLDAALRKTTDSIVRKLTNEFEQATAREQMLRSAYQAQARTVQDESETAIRYNMLKREADSNRQLYETMLSFVKEANVASALHAANVRLVDAGTAAQHSTRPMPAVYCAVGLTSGLLVAVAFVLLSGSERRTICTPGQSRIGDLPELGIIPRAELARQHFGFLRGTGSAMTLALSSRQDNAPALPLGFSGEPTMVADSVRAVMMSLMTAERRLKALRVIAITSTGPRDGKSSVLCGLGIAIAETGRKVLLLDGDVRRPHLHEVFRLANNEGLITLLNGSEQITPASVIQRTAVDGLFVLTSGADSSRASTVLLTRDALHHTVSQLRSEYDYILLDCPPMLHFADARALSAESDGVLLVVRAGQTTRPELAAAMQRLSEDHIVVIGTVLNDWQPAHDDTAYRAYYAYVQETSGS